MQIDVISDTVCPWCYIGKRRLERALAARPNMTFDVRWRAYRLDPTVPREGYDRKAYLEAKFGDSARVHAMAETIRAADEGEGIAFDYDNIRRTPNTLDSHRLVHWAGSAGVQDEAVERLFAAYFEEGRDIGDRKVLAAIAAEAGMDGDLAGDLLARDADIDLVEREDALAHKMGVSGVPTFIFGNKYSATGAHEPEILLQVIDKVAGELAVAV